jgi:hypothetical protein
VGLAKPLLHGRHEILAEPLQDQISDALDLREGIEVGGLLASDLEQRSIAEHLEGRAVDLPRALVTQQEELAQDREGDGIEGARAGDPQIAELVELAVGPASTAQGLEIVLRRSTPRLLAPLQGLGGGW